MLGACGKEQEPAPRVFDVKPPKGRKAEEFPSAGMALVRPRNWQLREREAPGVFELVSGQAVVAGWAYPRTERLPETDEELEAARDRLVEAIEERDPDFELRSTAIRQVAGARAIVVRGEQVVSRRLLRTRSVHVYEGEVEYVIEALSPPLDHELVVTRVLAPLLESLELEGEVREAAE